MDDREILETYLNLVSKNTSETDIFPHGTKSLLIDQRYLGVSAKDTINHNTAYRHKRYIHAADEFKKTDEEYSTKQIVPE